MYKYLFVITLIILVSACQSVQRGGAVPLDPNEKIRLDVLNIDWSDFSLAMGDRRIEDSGFVIANWVNTSDDVAQNYGALGVIVSDLSNEKYMKGSLELELKDNFDLAGTLINSLNNNQTLKASVKSIHLNESLEKQVITLEPWCIIFTDEQSTRFLPQLKAVLKSETGKAVWEGNYGPMKPSKPFILGNSMSNEDIRTLQSRLDIAYAEITNQLLSHIQGKGNYVSKEEGEKFTNDLLKSIEIDIDENELNLLEPL